LERSIAFYCDLLGLELQARGERHGEYINTLVGLVGVSLKFAVLGTETAPYAIELLAYSQVDTTSGARYSNSVGCNHIQFFVPDIEAAYRELSRRGIQFNSAPLLVPTGTKKAVYLRDPDGTILEFNQLLSGSSPYQGEQGVLKPGQNSR
jgi:catechol 2,3-dioxygenase-like lactoylglutathione lyase family enzyme